MSRLIILSVAALALCHGCIDNEKGRKNEEVKPIADVPDGEDGPWWKLPNGQLEEYVQRGLQDAEYVLVTTRHDQLGLSEVVIRDVNTLHKLSSAFHLASPRREMRAWDTPAVTYVDIHSPSGRIRFIIIGKYMLFGPWSEDRETRWRLQAFWEQVQLPREFMVELETQVEVARRGRSG